MSIVFLTALGVGGATILGSLLGLIFKSASHKFSDIVLSFAAGVMLSTAILGLIMPAIDYGGLTVTLIGIFCGALSLNLIDKVVPHFRRLVHSGEIQNKKLDKSLLLVIAIAIHNLPEGIAAGVGFGSGNVKGALMIAGGIALQNIPEGMVTVTPMLSAGVKPSKTFICGAITGIVEIAGTLMGYFAVSVADAILPFALAFAGGTMLFVVSDEMIPETHSDGNEQGATYALLIGFSLMLITDILL